MTEIPDEARAILESDALAHLVTSNPDGSAQVSCVWVGLEGSDIVFASLGPRRKLDNIRRDPRVALHPDRHRTIEPESLAGTAGLAPEGQDGEA